MFCKYCGKAVEEGIDFCGNCGKPIRNTTKKIKLKVIIIVIGFILVLSTICFAMVTISNKDNIDNGKIEIDKNSENTKFTEIYTDEEIKNMIGKYINYKPTKNTYTVKAEKTETNRKSEILYR